MEPRRIYYWPATLALLGLSCTSPDTPVEPTPLNPPDSTGVPRPPIYGPTTVRGTAYEHDGVGIHPVAGLRLLVSGLRDGSQVGIEVTTDVSGRYEVPLERGYLDVRLGPHPRYVAPCMIQLWLQDYAHEEPIDFHVVSKDTVLSQHVPRTMPPFVRPHGYQHAWPVAGLVLESTSSGAVAVHGATVEHLYGDGLSGEPSGTSLTTFDGSYTLCGYFDDFGQAIRVSKPGYRTAINLLWKMMDFELFRE